MRLALEIIGGLLLLVYAYATAVNYKRLLTAAGALKCIARKTDTISIRAVATLALREIGFEEDET